MTQYRYSIALFGRLEIHPRGEAPVPFGARQTGRLLAYLALHPDRLHPRTALIAEVWPSASGISTQRLLHKLAVNKRQLLTRTGGAKLAKEDSLLIAVAGGLGLNPATCRTDVQEFEAALGAAEAAPTDADRARWLQQALERCRGPLLPGFFDEWVISRRQLLEQSQLDALQQLARISERAGDFAAALQWARRMVEADPLDEDAQFCLIRLLAATDGRLAASRQYRQFCAALQRLDPAEPSEEIATRFQDLLGQPRAPRHDGLPANSPAPGLPGPNLRRHRDLARFFDREDELLSIVRFITPGERGSAESPPLPARRLVTVTGTGGVGKTRLAVEAALQLAPSFEDAAWFVPLAELTDAQRLHHQIQDALPLLPITGLPPVRQLAHVLGGKPALLVLDNLEQLLPGAVAPVAELLAELPELRILATSRHPLGLKGEQEVRIDPLRLPLESGRARAADRVADGGSPATSQCGSLTAVPSVELFLDRALAANARFQLTREDEVAIAALCRRLDGLPLAIELAAARCDTLSPPVLLERLSSALDLPPSRDPTADPRHVTLQQTIAWSYRLLSPEQQRFFARLSVFHGSWSLEAAQAVGQEPAAEELLDQLRAHSLVRIVPPIRAETGGISISGAAALPPDWDGPRYELLGTTREFAAGQLSASESAEVERQHAHYYLRLAESAEPELHHHNLPVWLYCLDTEHDNLRAALAWSVAASTPEVGLRLGAALYWFWLLRGHAPEGRDRLKTVLSLPEAHTIPVEWPRTLLAAGILTMYDDDYRRARSLLIRSLRAARRDLRSAAMRRHDELHRVIAMALNSLGQVKQSRGQMRSAGLLYRASLQTAEAAGDPPNVAAALNDLAQLAHHSGRPDTARQLLERCLPLARANGDPWRLAWVLNDLGLVFAALGELPTAEGKLTESLVLRRQVGSPAYEARSWYQLGLLARTKGDVRRSRSCLLASVRLLRGTGDAIALARALEILAWDAQAEGQFHPAARLLGAAEAMRSLSGTVLSLQEKHTHDTSARATLDALGEADYAAEYAIGRALSFDRAVLLAFEHSADSRTPHAR